MSDVKLAEYERDRDAVLENGTVENLIRFYKQYFPDADIPSREAFEVAFHKARSLAVNVSMQKRQVSDAWLKNRRYESFLNSNQ